MSMFAIENIAYTISKVIAALLAIMGHEVSHGLAAYRLGDPTARRAGRFTFNPLRHIDPVGLLMLIFLGFGWAKPVPVDMRYFQKPKRDMALTALAGPVSNFLMAWLGLMLLHLVPFLPQQFTEVAWIFLYTLVMINIGLGVFNLIPFPPLDGSKIAGSLLPDRWYYRQLQGERYGAVILMVLLFTNVLDKPLAFMRDLMLNGLSFLSFW